MELLGLKFERDGGLNGNSAEYNVCYMLFPYIETSLRGELTERNVLLESNAQRRPFSIREVLNIFEGILEGISAMHSCNLSHRDLKIENILLKRDKNYRDRSRSASAYTPILMDFGSAGALFQEISTRHSVLSAIEMASQHTTISYRPPELFEGGMRHDANEKLNYGKVDVWSLGCIFFGLMHACSPFEMDFVRSNDPYNEDIDAVRIVECTQLKILSLSPFPPWAASGGGGSNAKQSNIGGRYPLVMYEFVRFMVCHDRRKRPDVQQVRVRFGELYLGLMGERWNGGSKNVHGKEKRGDEFDSLIASRDFV
jgi:serine/threonine protein kinase